MLRYAVARPVFNAVRKRIATIAVNVEPFLAWASVLKHRICH
eukprot:COSAG06_NODE_53126_length_301_cov_35.787129_1_plen_41_part_10